MERGFVYLQNPAGYAVVAACFLILFGVCMGGSFWIKRKMAQEKALRAAMQADQSVPKNPAEFGSHE